MPRMNKSSTTNAKATRKQAHQQQNFRNKKSQCYLRLNNEVHGGVRLLHIAEKGLSFVVIIRVF